MLQEKFNLQRTLKTLTEEVEFLSRKNEIFLKELKTKDYYGAYKQQNDELTKLREAHTLLINMIGTKDISVKRHERHSQNSRKTSNSFTLGGFLVGDINSKKAFRRLTRASMPPLKRILSCNQSIKDNNGGQAGVKIESEPFETMESV